MQESRPPYYQPGPPPSLPPQPPKPPAWGYVWPILAVLIALCLGLLAGYRWGKGDMVGIGDLLNPTSVAIAPTPLPTTTPRPLPTLAPIRAVPTATPGFTTGRIGDRLVNGGYILTVNGAEKSNSYNPIITPKAGNEFIAVDITIESTANSGVSTSPSYAFLQDSAGFRYDFSLASKEPGLPSNLTVTIGQKVRGWVTFEVPKNDTGLMLNYRPALDTLRFSVAVN